MLDAVPIVAAVAALEHRRGRLGRYPWQDAVIHWTLHWPPEGPAVLYRVEREGIAWLS